MSNEIEDVEKFVLAVCKGKDDKAKELLSKALKKKCADKVAHDLGLKK